ncbi:DUF1877 family protein [Streptomyces sp. NPDC057496]|uniref:DUF1877 family protein n=1 Tax=Streptomyces sp. NPDC057496 TaxID=3346149 RepID=UPI0036C84594
MSIHLHFRAVAKSEIRDDHTWLAAFMHEAWQNHPAEYAEGVAGSIEKVFGLVNDLYAAAETLGTDVDAGTDAGVDTGVGRAWELPVHGGRPVAHGAGADPSDPPMMLLEPPGVARAADFLAGVSFDELWSVAGAGVCGRLGEEAQARQEFLRYHEDLRRLYGRAASAGRAMVKVVWA